MKVGILSDTHTKVELARQSIDFLLHEGAEFLIHAGDIVEPETLELLKSSGVRYIAVYGNNDAHLVSYHNKYNLVQEPYYFKLSNTTVKLMHLPFYMTPDAEVVVFGHTHKFEVEFQNNTLYINPGEVCARNKPLSECAMLHIENDTFTLNYYTRKKNKNYKLNETFHYQRDRK